MVSGRRNGDRDYATPTRIPSAVMTTELGGRKIVITGAATGIGLAAVREISKLGAQVAAIYHNSPPPPSRANGPPHSSQVVLLTGGL